MAELYVGLISGTSTDGIDAVLVDFAAELPVVIDGLTHPYPAELRTRIESIISPQWQGSLTEIGRLHAALGSEFAKAANRLLDVTGTRATQVKAIGSHGQTVCHAPGDPDGFTLQLGDANRICTLTGISTVADFRGKDVALGGEGAPLVPAFHAATLGSASEDRVVLNLGGIANITRLPARAASADAGFDTGPANTLMDGWIQRHRGERYDRAGSWAATGQVDDTLLQHLLAEPYLKLRPPKSTGRERFNMDWLDRHLECLTHLASPADIQATLLEFTARTVTMAIDREGSRPSRLIACGGGAHNTQLMRRIAGLLPDVRVVMSDAFGIPVDWMEAMAFAWLARETLHHRPGNIPAVTGASRAAVLGAIYTND